MLSFISLTCLQTHNVTLAGPISDFVVAMGSDGRIVSQGTVADALEHDKTLAKGLKHEEEAVELTVSVWRQIIYESMAYSDGLHTERTLVE